MAPSKQRSPVGLPLGKNYRVGKLLGEGSFGQVYAVDGPDPKWACKITATPLKKTRKADSIAEINHQRLNSEYMLYSNHFLHLAGTVVPRLPLESQDGLKKYFDDHDGFRCLVMERMESRLFDVLPALVSAPGATIPLGSIACKLIDLVEAVHKTTHILLDVKPDNIMVSTASSKVKLSSSTLADLLRLVDFGTSKSIGGVHGHKPNDGTKQVQGTPLYASLHVHALQTPSRRDDLESVLYVIGEMVLRLVGACNGTEPTYGQGDGASYLPWSQETSDEAIGKVKKESVSNINSAYYSQMPKTSATILFRCFEAVHQCSYSKAPDYNLCRKLLGDLKVERPAKKIATASNRSSRRKTKESSRTAYSAGLKDESPPSKNHKTSTRYALDDSDVEMEDAEDTTAPDELEDMIINDDDGKPAAVKKFRGIKLLCKGISSPSIALVAGEVEGLVFGSNPPAGGDNETSIAVNDTNLAAAHVRVTLSKAHHGVDVDVLSKKAVVLVNRVQVPPSGITVFVGQLISFGEIQLEVADLRKKDYKLMQARSDENFSNALQEAQESLPATRKRSTRSSGAMAEASNIASNTFGSAKKGKKPDAVVKVTSGPHAGEEAELKKERVPTIVVGSAPTRSGHHLILSRAENVAANHARLDLIVKDDGVVMVKVTDLKSGKATSLNGKRIPAGKDGMAFCGQSLIELGDTTLEIV